jgi:SET domain-containing protein
MYVVDVEVSQSPINGQGVFASSDIPKGKIVWLFQQDYDQRLTNNAFQKLPSDKREYLSHTAYFSPWSNLWVFPPENDPAEYTNHSDEHNLSVVFDESVSPEPYFVANKNIQAGEEITNNYHDFDKITRQTKPNWAKQKHIS